jgi:amylosucrase
VLCGSLRGRPSGLRERIPYLLELGVNYLHLMPLYKVPEGDNDGGYAVSSYRELNPRLGTMEDLAELASELRHHGLSLCMDFVFNHTSDEHDWARKALAGDAEYQSYYRMFPDRSEPDAYERTLVPVFPDEHPGSFTYRNRLKKWVWTSFHNYQWDLNYENPAVFNRMLEEMLFLANQGVEILRMDAVAFVWKRLGTSSQNLPEAHVVLKAFNALVRIAAPAMLFKSEAIVHPDEVRKYISEDECQLSYNPQLMALLWNSLATRKVRILRHAMEKRFSIPAGCSWVNYVRCHDDIGFRLFQRRRERVGPGSVCPPALSHRILYRSFSRQLRPRCAVPGRQGYGRGPHLWQLCLPGRSGAGLEEGDEAGNRAVHPSYPPAAWRDPDHRWHPAALPWG